MATINGSTNNSNWKFKLEAYELSYNTPNNTSVVRVDVYIGRTSSRSYCGGTFNGSVNVDGQVQGFSGTISYPTYIDGGAWHYTGVTKDFTVGHNADGSKSVGVSASWGADFNPTSANASGSIGLTTIPRASQPSCVTRPNTTQNVGKLGDKITIYMNRASSSFTHTVKYAWGNKSGTIATGVTDSTTWTLPKNFAENVPNGTSGTGTITVDTYNGGTHIGSKSVSFTASIPDTDEFRPSITGLTLWENSGSDVPSDWGFYVQNKSKLSYDITANGIYNSTIKSYTVSVNGLIYYSKAYTTAELVNSGTNTISVTVTDSRGRTATYSETFEVVKYDGPILNKFTVNRCLEDGTIDEEGTYAKVDISAAIPRLNDKNEKSYSLKYKDSDSSEYVIQEVTLDETTDDSNYILTGSIIIEADENKEFDYLFILADSFISIDKKTSIDTIFQLINFHEDGTGMALGKMSSRGHALEINMDVYDKFDQLITNGLAEYKSGGVDIDPDTTLKTLILTETNTPKSNGFYYILTMFYASKSLESSRTQIAIPYIYNISQNKKIIYIRQNVEGTWNDWYAINSNTIYDYTLSEATDTIIVTGLDIVRDGGEYEFEFRLMSNSTTISDVSLIFNDLKEGYHHSVHRINGGISADGDLNAGQTYYPKRANIHEWMHTSILRPYPSIFKGRVFITPDDNNKYKFNYSIKVTQNVNGEQVIAFIEGVNSVSVSNITRLQFTVINSSVKFGKNSRLIIKRVD